ncbi:hypothetical protein GT204_11095 [Streptomyces sp. SID4919]|uniref:hypothetical protein n=1 Tax=Streptomyces sp. AmelKG-E11A TaxID=1100822 RepID=UPI000823C9AB|nr:hypothetical protein [Streptomyces sp. SID4919]SCK59736.1 hypothetical protein YW7DRAFT_05793 [Streptomyces sp. AmelKG-E11A]
MRNWYFNLVLQDALTEEQDDALTELAGFHDGRISLAERPGYSRFVCSFEAETLTQAIADALSRFVDLPGVLVRSVELDEIALDDNGMWTPAVVLPPPPLEAGSSAS